MKVLVIAPFMCCIAPPEILRLNYQYQVIVVNYQSVIVCEAK